MKRLILSPPPSPIEATVIIPGSKSYTIRALLLAALVNKKTTGHPVRLLNPLFSDDTEAMLNCLSTLGIRTERSSDYIDVIGDISDIQPGKHTLNADLSAASIRFLIALSAVIPGTQTLLGKEGLNNRPVRELVSSLRQMGAQIEYTERDGYPPVRISSESLQAKQVSVDGSISSQYISALIMIAPLIAPTDGELVIEITGEPVSKPYIQMTLDIMQAFGVNVKHDNYHRFVIVGGQAYQATKYTVEADASSAAYFAALAALSQSKITLSNLNPTSAQADMRFLDILETLGSRIERDNPKGQITITGRGLKPIAVDMQDCPDQAQTLAVLAAFADGETRITGIQSLRIKETNRLEAVATELAKMGIRTIVEEDALTIFGGHPQAAAIDTYGDHRMAMSFAVAGAKLAGLQINDPGVVSKTFPSFWTAWQNLGITIRWPQPEKIVLIGFMGSGKSTVAPVLAKKLNYTAVDMDRLILDDSAYNSIKEIFETEGEAAFRAKELAVAEALAERKNLVISAGGGVVTNPQLMSQLAKNALIVYLQTDLQTVLRRVDLNNGRPLLKTAAQAEALYTVRAPLYRQYAHCEIDTNGKSETQIAEEISALLLSAIESEALA